MMNRIWIVLFTLVFFSGCVHNQTRPVDQPVKLTAIIYALEPFRTFQISGTDVKGVELKDLKVELAKYSKAHPGTIYELFAEVKSTLETEKEIVGVFKDAGVTLQHYWAPVSEVDPNAKPGKYGLGHVDILK